MIIKFIIKDGIINISLKTINVQRNENKDVDKVCFCEFKNSGKNLTTKKVRVTNNPYINVNSLKKLLSTKQKNKAIT